MKRPISDVVNGVFKILQENKLQVNQQSVECVVSAMTEWLESTQRGHEMMVYLLQLEHVNGQHDKEYCLEDGYGRLTDTIKPENIVFLRGAVSNGEVLPIRQIRINDKEIVHCEGCGSRTVCSDEVQDKEFQGMSLCSYCLVMSGDPNLAKQVFLSCSTCTYSRCQWHPRHQEYALGVS